MFARHAPRTIRVQQRSVPPFVIELLREHGVSIRAGGADKLYFDGKSRRELQRRLGWLYEKLGSKLNAYAVIADNGELVTAGYRTGRIPRR